MKFRANAWVFKNNRRLLRLFDSDSYRKSNNLHRKFLRSIEIFFVKNASRYIFGLFNFSFKIAFIQAKNTRSDGRSCKLQWPSVRVVFKAKQIVFIKLKFCFKNCIENPYVLKASRYNFK
jgi:hypothetical protein